MGQIMMIGDTEKAFMYSRICLILLHLIRQFSLIWHIFVVSSKNPIFYVQVWQKNLLHLKPLL